MWLTIIQFALAGWIIALVTVYMVKYMPRLETISSLKKQLKEVKQKNSELSEHLSVERIERAEDAADFALKMIEAKAEIEKQKGLAEQWAEEAEKFRRKAEGVKDAAD